MNRRRLATAALTLGLGTLAPYALAQDNAARADFGPPAAPADNLPRVEFGPAPPADFSPPPPDTLREEATVTSRNPEYVAPPDAVVVHDSDVVIVPSPTVVPGRDRLMVHADEPSTLHHWSPNLFDPRGADYSGA